MDYAAFQLVNRWAGHSVWLDRAFVLLAQYGALIFIAALAWLWLVPADGTPPLPDRLAAARAASAAALALALGQLIILAFARPRPFTAHAVHLLIPPTADPSFPSDHALAAFAIATALGRSHPKLGRALLGLSVALGLARIFVGTHYPLDVLGGALIGAAVGGGIHHADGILRAPVAWLGVPTDAVRIRIASVTRPRVRRPLGNSPDPVADLRGRGFVRPPGHRPPEPPAPGSDRA